MNIWKTSQAVQFSEGPGDYEIFEDDSLKATDENQE